MPGQAPPQLIKLALCAALHYYTPKPPSARHPIWHKVGLAPSFVPKARQAEEQRPSAALLTDVARRTWLTGFHSPFAADIVLAMTYRATIRGYLLEEALAWLLRHSGYRLLVHESQDPDELVMRNGALHVKGRGAVHQADVLGEFALTPAFSLPIRLFIEAKYYRTPCQLQVVRNGHGVLHDVNENFVHHPDSRPRRRYQYAYALFSASGFTHPAQDYALAQQISLIDLSGESFRWLREPITGAAADLYARRNYFHITRFPVSWMRTQLRSRLGTAVLGDQAPDLASANAMPTNAPAFRAAAQEVIAAFTAQLRGRESAELLLGFPAAPFILPLASDDPAGFLAYANHHPSHAVRLRRSGSGPEAEWTVSPMPDGQAGHYEVTFRLPDHVESWISENDERRRKRTGLVKEGMLSYITVYRSSGGETQIYQLRYEPSDLRQPRM